MDKLKTLWDNLTGREKMILHLVVLITLGALFYTFEYEKQTLRLKKAKAKANSVQQNLASYQAAFRMNNSGDVQQEIERAKMEIIDLQDEIQFLKTQMSGDPVDVVKALRRQADKLEARMESLQTREEVVDSGRFRYKEVTLKLEMVSSYQGLGSFVRSLDAIPALLSIKKLTINRNRNLLPEVKTDLTIQLYVL